MVMNLVIVIFKLDFLIKDIIVIHPMEKNVIKFVKMIKAIYVKWTNTKT